VKVEDNKDDVVVEVALVAQVENVECKVQRMSMNVLVLASQLEQSNVYLHALRD
jgi:hypothetical protein